MLEGDSAEKCARYCSCSSGVQCAQQLTVTGYQLQVICYQQPATSKYIPATSY